MSDTSVLPPELVVGTSVVVLVLSLCIYRLSHSSNNSKKSNDDASSHYHHMPPEGISFQNFIDLARSMRLVLHQLDWYDKYGPVFWIKSPFPLLIPEQVIIADVAVTKELVMKHGKSTNAKFTTRPPDIAKALTGGEGAGLTTLMSWMEEWKWRKQSMLKQFHNSRLRERQRNLLPIIFENAQTLCDTFERRSSSNEAFEVDIETTKVAINVILYFFCGRKNCIEYDAAEFRKAGDIMTHYVAYQLFHPWHPIVKYIPGTTCYKARMEKDQAWDIVDRALEKEFGRVYQEFKGEIPTHPDRTPGSAVVNMLETEPRFEQLGVKRITEELRGLVLGGFESTGHSIAFAIGLLAEYPDMATRIAREGRAAGLCDTKKKKLFEDTDFLRQLLDACPTALAFFHETLRLFPPFPSLGGECLEDCTVTDSNGISYLLKKGTKASFMNYSMQRRQCPPGGKNADVLDPDRWTKSFDGADSTTTTTTTRPFLNTFNNGHHVCPGKNLAILEGQMSVLLAATRFEFQFADDNDEKKVKIDAKSTVFLVPENGMMLKAKKRVTW